ncbi:hypothetical protein QTP88_022683 [Uroleucon formosanum]
MTSLGHPNGIWMGIRSYHDEGRPVRTVAGQGNYRCFGVTNKTGHRDEHAVGGEIHTVHVLRVLRSDAREPTKLRFPQLLRERRPPLPPSPPPFHLRSNATTTSPPPNPPPKPTPFFVVIVAAAAVAVVRSPTASHCSQ